MSDAGWAAAMKKQRQGSEAEELFEHGTPMV